MEQIRKGVLGLGKRATSGKRDYHCASIRNLNVSTDVEVHTQVFLGTGLALAIFISTTAFYLSRKFSLKDREKERKYM